MDPKKITGSPKGPLDPLGLSSQFDVLHVVLFLTAFCLLLVVMLLAAGLIRSRAGYTLPTRSRKGEATNNVIVLGIGGVGKTSVIRQLTGNRKANPDIKTNEFEIYTSSIIEATTGQSGRIRTLRLADYKGQNLGTLISGFCRMQLRPYSPLRWGHVNSLVIVVDLFKFQDTSKITALRREQPDRVRIDENIRNWVSPTEGGTSVFDAVFGLVTDDIRLVCLFINKTDLLVQDDDEAMRRSLEDFYKPIQDEIRRRPLKCKIVVKTGSAERGTGIVGNDSLRDLLDEHAR